MRALAEIARMGVAFSVAALALNPSARAQEPDVAPLTASASFPADRFVAADAAIEITLSRALRGDEGRIAIVVGAHELTPLFEHVATRLVFRGHRFRLPGGNTDVKVFLVSERAWREIASFPLRVLTRGGFESVAIDPGLTLNNKGQLASGYSGSAAEPERATYQDATASFGLQTSHVRNGWTLQTQMNAMGVTNEKEALRFGTQGDNAMRIDLSDYVVRLERAGAQLAAGQVNFGQNRHLISGFTSRGVTAVVSRGPATLSVGAMNGSSIVGWDNIIGLNDSDHRVTAAALALELMPQRPGGMHIDFSVLDGSLLPNTGYSEAGVVDAETSLGFGVQFAASTASQRLRASGGMTRTRFDNGADSELFGDLSVVPTRAQRKAARYFEATAGLLQNAKLLKAISATMNATYRHERVDPLYRSVAAYTQADIDRNVFELSGNMDAVNVQFSHNRSGDNLDHVASVLTTSTRVSGASLSVPLATLLRITGRAALFPMLSITRQQTHQQGETLPDNADFQPSHVPDQLSVVEDMSLQWQGTHLRFGYRFNRSKQDNRQPGREASDLKAGSNNFTIGYIPGANVDMQLDASLERQENLEFAQVNRVRRLGLTANWRMNVQTTIDAFVSRSTTNDEAAASTAGFTEARIGLSRAIKIWRTADGAAPPGQLFVRLARQSNALTQAGDAALSPPAQSGASWNVASGLSLRLF